MTESRFIELLRAGAGPLPRGRRTLPPGQVEDVHRRRLVAGMAEAASEHGYLTVTIADVVRCAQVSRRTFYEHFADKEACFLEAYRASAELQMGLITAAVADEEQPFTERIAAGVTAYFDTLASEPALARLFLVDLIAVGPVALEHRRRTYQRFAELIADLVDDNLEVLPPGWGVEPLMATAFVGAINELALLALEGPDPSLALPRMKEPALRLLYAVLAPDGRLTPEPEHLRVRR